MFNTTELSLAAAKFERKKRIEMAINHILPCVASLGVEKEMLRRMAKGQPPSVPIFSYTIATRKMPADTVVHDGETTTTVAALCDEESMLNGHRMNTLIDGEVIQVLYTILGPNFSIARTYTNGRSTEYLKLIEVTLVTTFHVTPRQHVLTWVHEMWPNISKIAVVNDVVNWNEDEDGVNEGDAFFLNRMHRAEDDVEKRLESAEYERLESAEAAERLESVEAPAAEAQPTPYMVGHAEGYTHRSHSMPPSASDTLYKNPQNYMDYYWGYRAGYQGKEQDMETHEPKDLNAYQDLDTFNASYKASLAKQKASYDAIHAFADKQATISAAKMHADGVVAQVAVMMDALLPPPINDMRPHWGDVGLSMAKMWHGNLYGIEEPATGLEAADLVDMFRRRGYMNFESDRYEEIAEDVKKWRAEREGNIDDQVKNVGYRCPCGLLHDPSVHCPEWNSQY